MSEQILDYKTIVKLRKKLLKLNDVEINKKTLSEIKEIYDSVTLEFIDLEVSTSKKDKIVLALTKSSQYFNLLEEADFIRLDNDLIKRNETLAILSKTSIELNKVLIEFQKEIGIQ